MKFLRKWGLAIVAASLIVGNMIYALLFIPESYESRNIFDTIYNAFLATVLLFCIGWVINYFRTHRKSKGA